MEAAMADQSLPKQPDCEAQRAALLQRVQNILDSDDEELIEALVVLLGALENTMPGAEGGAA